MFASPNLPLKHKQKTKYQYLFTLLSYPHKSNIDVGQTHVGDSLVAPPVIVLLIDGEGHQSGIGPTVLGNGVGADALEVKFQPIKGVIVWVPPAPADSSVVGNTRCTAVLDLACLLGPGRNPSMGLTVLWQAAKGPSGAVSNPQ
uniref:Uncharacterized protein n=1 Tax=Chrysemys picta bellii TaxID=8478 RepID=A0A8C3FRK4_CHRPI